MAPSVLSVAPSVGYGAIMTSQVVESRPAAPAAATAAPTVPTPAGPRTLRAVPPVAPAFVEALSTYRSRNGLTLREAGRLVGGSHSVWGRWEAGGVPSP